MTYTLPHLSWIDIPVSAAVSQEQLDAPTSPTTVDLITWALCPEPDDEAVRVFERGSWELVFSQFSIDGGRLTWSCPKTEVVGRRQFNPPLLLSPDVECALRLRFVEDNDHPITSSAKVRFCLHGWTEREG